MRKGILSEKFKESRWGKLILKTLDVSMLILEVMLFATIGGIIRIFTGHILCV